MNRLKEFRRKLLYMPKALSIVWQASRRWTVAWLIILVIQSILPVLTVTFTREAVNKLVNLFNDRQYAQFEAALIPITGLVVVLAFTRILSALGGWVRLQQSELVKDHISEL